MHFCACIDAFSITFHLDASPLFGCHTFRNRMHERAF
jgi:hypothetical protein